MNLQDADEAVAEPEVQRTGVGLRRADARFLLPYPPSSALLLGGAQDWGGPLSRSRVAVSTEAGMSEGVTAELVVTGVAGVARAISTGARMVIVEGCSRRARNTLVDAGYSVTAYLMLPDCSEPELMVPIEMAAPLRYALSVLRPSTTRMGRWRNRAGGPLLSSGLYFPEDLVTAVAIAARPRAGSPALSVDHPPYPLGSLAVPGGGWIFLGLGGPHSAARVVGYCFSPGGSVPSSVVKFPRLVGAQASDDLRALAMVHESRGTASAHAPLPLGQWQNGGTNFCAETAAIGHRLSRFLESGASRSANEKVVDQVAEWVIAVQRESVAPHEHMERRRQDLGAAVARRWGRGTAGCLLARRRGPATSLLSFSTVTFGPRTSSLTARR
ncbi:MAG: hypothetical protein ACYDH5_05300 [Acidimicrobiales bacterium]